MIVLGANVPLSAWTAVVAVLGTAGALLIHQRLARWARLRRLPTLVALIALSCVLALTVTPGTVTDQDHWTGCLPTGESTLHLLGHDTENVLNWLLMVPFAAAMVVASGRVLLPAGLTAVIPAVIELAQLVVPGRLCSTPDYLANVLGGLVAVAIIAAARKARVSSGTAKTLS